MVVFHEGDSQGEGHGDPFARPHAHGTPLPLEAGSVPRKSRSRLPGGLETRSRPRRRCPPRGWRHPESSRERLAAGHRSGRRSEPDTSRYGLCGRGSRPRRTATGPQRATISWFDGRCISLHRANTWSGSATLLRVYNRPGSQIPTPGADWLCWCSAQRRTRPLSPWSDRSWCCNRSTAATCPWTTSPATSASTWTSAPRDR